MRCTPSHRDDLHAYIALLVCVPAYAPQRYRSQVAELSAEKTALIAEHEKVRSVLHPLRCCEYMSVTIHAQVQGVCTGLQQLLDQTTALLKAHEQHKGDLEGFLSQVPSPPTHRFVAKFPSDEGAVRVLLFLQKQRLEETLRIQAEREARLREENARLADELARAQRVRF